MPTATSWVLEDRCSSSRISCHRHVRFGQQELDEVQVAPSLQMVPVPMRLQQPKVSRIRRREQGRMILAVRVEELQARVFVGLIGQWRAGRRPKWLLVRRDLARLGFERFVA